MSPAFRIDGIPRELTRRPRWVVWRLERRNGKPTKVPYTASGDPASSTDPSTWTTFMRAVLACERRFYSGIGFVLGDGIAGVDLDDCRLPDGGLHPAAKSLLRKADTYTEWSPSGTGAKAFLFGSKNGHPGCKTPATGWGGDLEVYDRGRFFTVTGDLIFGFPPTINNRQVQLERLLVEFLPTAPDPQPVARRRAVVPVVLDDVELLERARGAANGERFAALFDFGNTSGYRSDSEADLALAGLLLFWTGGDVDRADTLFRSSALWRPKWDEKRGPDSTYGQRTIARALRDKSEFYEGPASWSHGGGGWQGGLLGRHQPRRIGER